MLSQEFVMEMKAKLLEAKTRFNEDLAGLNPHTEVGNDQGENAEEVELDEVNQDMIARINSDLAKIEAALLKIEEGTYGVDAEGKEISEARLRVLPWADKAV